MPTKLITAHEIITQAGLAPSNRSRSKANQFMRSECQRLIKHFDALDLKGAAPGVWNKSATYRSLDLTDDKEDLTSEQSRAILDATIYFWNDIHHREGFVASATLVDQDGQPSVTPTSVKIQVSRIDYIHGHVEFITRTIAVVKDQTALTLATFIMFGRFCTDGMKFYPLPDLIEPSIVTMDLGTDHNVVYQVIGETKANVLFAQIKSK